MAKSTELTAASSETAGISSTGAAVRYKKSGCRTTTRPSDRPGTDDRLGTTTTARAPRGDAGPQNDADGWGAIPLG